MSTKKLKESLKIGLMIAPDLLGLATVIGDAAQSREEETVQPTDTSWLFDSQNREKKPDPVWKIKMAENPTGEEIDTYLEVNEEKFRELLQFLASLLVNQEFFCQQPNDENYQQFKRFVLSEMEKAGRDFDLIVEPAGPTALQILNNKYSTYAYLITKLDPEIFGPWRDSDAASQITFERVMIPIEQDECDAYFWIMLARLLNELVDGESDDRL